MKIYGVLEENEKIEQGDIIINDSAYDIIVKENSSFIGKTPRQLHYCRKVMRLIANNWEEIVASIIC